MCNFIKNWHLNIIEIVLHFVGNKKWSSIYHRGECLKHYSFFTFSMRLIGLASASIFFPCRVGRIGWLASQEGVISVICKPFFISQSRCAATQYMLWRWKRRKAHGRVKAWSVKEAEDVKGQLRIQMRLDQSKKASWEKRVNGAHWKTPLQSQQFAMLRWCLVF